MESQPTVEKYVNGSVGARVRLMVRGGCLPVRGSIKEWKYDDDRCLCGRIETEIHVCFLKYKCYAMARRRWMRTWDVLDEKEKNGRNKRICGGER